MVTVIFPLLGTATVSCLEETIAPKTEETIGFGGAEATDDPAPLGPTCKSCNVLGCRSTSRYQGSDHSKAMTEDLSSMYYHHTAAFFTMIGFKATCFGT